MTKYFRESSQVYIADLMGSGYEFRRSIDDMELYKRGDHVILAKRINRKTLEILLNIEIDYNKSEEKRKWIY